MEDLSVVSLVLGVIIGFVVGGSMVFGYYRFPGSAREDRAARKREEAYREEVADHFVKTADLVNNLTDSYKEVFDHLREGAGRLVDEKILQERLAHRDDDKVTLRRIGYGSGRSQSEARTKSSSDKSPAAGDTAPEKKTSASTTTGKHKTGESKAPESETAGSEASGGETPESKTADGKNGETEASKSRYPDVKAAGKEAHAGKAAGGTAAQTAGSAGGAAAASATAAGAEPAAAGSGAADAGGTKDTSGENDEDKRK